MSSQCSIQKISTPDIKNIILVASGKGGVGKSTVASGLALALARDGYKTALLDADIYGPSIPVMFEIEDKRPDVKKAGEKNMIIPFEKFGVKLMSLGFFIEQSQAVVWRGPMASNAIKQLIEDTDWGDTDYLIIDTPPGTGDIHISLLQDLKISGVFIVTTPQSVATVDVQKAISFFTNKESGAKVYGIVENMAWFTPTAHPQEKYFLFGKGGADKLSQQFNIPVVARVPIDEFICDSCDRGKLNGIFGNSLIEQSFDSMINAIK